MRKIAVLGSRAWPDRDAVISWIDARYAAEGQFILVSGGAKGASETAEQHAQAMGLPVISLRPVKIPDHGFYPQYAVDEWRLFRGSGKIINRREVTWADWSSAASYRSMLIAERADEGVAFWDGRSPGTSDEIDFFRWAGKPLEVVKIGQEGGEE